MTKEEFISNCCSLGYCSKAMAEKYCVGKDELTDDDYITIYQRAQKIELRASDGWHRCGNNGGKTTKSYKFYNGHEG